MAGSNDCVTLWAAAVALLASLEAVILGHHISFFLARLVLMLTISGHYCGAWLIRCLLTGESSTQWALQSFNIPAPLMTRWVNLWKSLTKLSPSLGVTLCLISARTLLCLVSSYVDLIPLFVFHFLSFSFSSVCLTVQFKAWMLWLAFVHASLCVRRCTQHNVAAASPIDFDFAKVQPYFALPVKHDS